jgi:hypothetical protein
MTIRIFAATLFLLFRYSRRAKEPAADTILTNDKIVTVDDRFTIGGRVASRSIWPDLAPSRGGMALASVVVEWSSCPGTTI